MEKKQLGTTLVTAAAGALAIFAMSGMQAYAHHSWAMYDDSRVITVSGTVAGVSFANPHVNVSVQAAVGNGEPDAWSVRMGSIGDMTNRGVNADTIGVGDEIVVTINPLRDGRNAGNYTRIVSINGVENAAEGTAWAPVR